MTAIHETSPYPFLTMRLWDHHKSPAVLDAYLRLLKRRRGACDEVWFATDYGFPPLVAHRRFAEQMAVAAEKIRAAGFVTSLQISNTMGHGSYLKYLDFRGITWQRMVGPDGTVAPWSNCPRAPAFHEYLRESLHAYCAWNPASVWIDDDLRMQNHRPVEHGCFCPGCLEAFAVETGQPWTRGRLVKAINAGNDIATRRAWIEFSRHSLTIAAGVIAQAVKDVAPEARMGYQHCDHCWGGYNGSDWLHVFGELARVSGRPVGSRPGGGFYVDHAPRGMIDKVLFTGLQNSRLPGCVDDARVEVENLPGAVTGKSAAGTVVEATLALAYGCTGLTFTPLMFTHEGIAWHEKVLTKIAAWRPFWLWYLEASRGTKPAGLELVLSRRHLERALRPGEEPFAWATCAIGGVAQMTVYGLPLCWGDDSPVAGLLHPNAADGLGETELRAVLRRGVITDGETIRRLQDRGFGRWLGVKAVVASDRDQCERFTNDQLNGPYAGRPVYLTGLYGGFPAYVLEPRSTRARCLSRYEWSDGTIAGAAAMALESTEGGRLVVFGKALWETTVITARRAQILAAADWVSRGRLPVLLETPGQVMAVPRCDPQGRLRSALLLNCSLDPAPRLALRLRRLAGGKLSLIRPEQNRPVPVKRTRGANRAETLVTVPSLPPWSVAVLVVNP